jgi:hypothetical protein
MFLSRVGVPDDVPNHVTANPVGSPQSCEVPALYAGAWLSRLLWGSGASSVATRSDRLSVSRASALAVVGDDGARIAAFTLGLPAWLAQACDGLRPQCTAARLLQLPKGANVFIASLYNAYVHCRLAAVHIMLGVVVA